MGVPGVDGVLVATAPSAVGSDDLPADKEAHGYVDVPGAKIYYEELGSGPAIVLLHDGLLASESWDEVWRPLATKYHVIRYDRRGYGRSDPASSSFSSTEDLAILLRHLKVPRAVVAGSSSGAALAIDFALIHPEMAAGLFLVGPVLHGLEFSAEFRDRSNRNNQPIERDDARGMARNWSQDKFMIGGANAKARRKIYEELVLNAEKLKTYDGALEEKLSPPASNRLGEITAPTLILVGEGDITDVQTHCDAIKAGIPGSDRVAVKGAGHLIQLEKPDEVLKHLNDFATRCERK